jgi:hypothetical protein
MLHERDAALRLPTQTARRTRLGAADLLRANDRIWRRLKWMLNRNRRARFRWRIGEAHDLACNAMVGACVAANQILGHLPAINDEMQRVFIEYGELSAAFPKPTQPSCG